MARTATLVQDHLPGFTGHAALYRLSEPLAGNEYVIASAVDVTYGEFDICETYLFPADAAGQVTDWGELPGSLKNTTAHADAIAEAGYSIAN